jgi:ABC-type multidrug transport system fused ATPase/permease subunit
LGGKFFGLLSGRTGASVHWGWRRGFCGARASWPSPALIAHTIDTAIAGDHIGAVILDSLVITVAGAAGAFAAALHRWWPQRLGFLVERDIRARLVRHAYRLRLGFHSEVASGVLVSRISSDLLQIQQPLCRAVRRLAPRHPSPLTMGVDRESSLDIQSGEPHAVVYELNSHLGGFRLVR